MAAMTSPDAAAFATRVEVTLEPPGVEKRDPTGIPPWSFCDGAFFPPRRLTKPRCDSRERRSAGGRRGRLGRRRGLDGSEPVEPRLRAEAFERLASLREERCGLVAATVRTEVLRALELGRSHVERGFEVAEPPLGLGE